MQNYQTESVRILAISPSSQGFGYAVMEGDNQIVAADHKRFSSEKNIRSLEHIQKFIIRYSPDVLVVPDVNAKGTHRALRIKKLQREIVAVAKKRKLKVVMISETKLRRLLLGNQAGTKQEMAELLAKKFPDELASRLPEKRKAWKSEDARMDIFDAVGLVLAHRGQQ